MRPIRRDQISDYLLTPSGIQPLAAGVLSLSERPGPVFAPFSYPEEGAGGAVSGYGTAFPFRVRLVADDPACAFLWAIARGRRIGPDAETELYRVERFSGTPCPARRLRVAVLIEEVGGLPGEPVTLEGSFRQLGDAQEGAFDPATRAFQAAT